MIKLYQIADQYRELLALDDPDLPAAAIADTLDGLRGDLETKAASVAAYFSNLEAEVDAMLGAEKRIKARREILERKIAAGREYLRSSMERAGIRKINGPELSLALKKCPARVDIYDESLVAELYWREKVSRAVDKDMVGDALKAGIDVPGCRLVQATRLHIG